MAKKKSSKTDQTEAQDKAAEDARAPETPAAGPEGADTETPRGDTLEETPEPTAEAPGDTATVDDTQTPPEQTAEQAPDEAPEPEPLEEAGPETASQDTAQDSPEPETAPDAIDHTPGDDPSAEIATLTEAEAAQEDQGSRGQSDTPAPVTKTEQVTIRQGGFWSMLFGGIVAAGIGVVAAPYVLPDHPLNPAEDNIDPAQLQDRIAAQETALGDLRSKVESIEPASEPVPDLSGDLGELRNTLTDLAAQVSSIESRVAELEDRPTPETGGSDVSSAQLDDLRAALAEQRETLEAQRAEIDALKNEAAAEEAAARDSARATLQRAALTRVRTALDSSEPFTDALANLRETGVEPPAALSNLAETGVPTQGALADAFPAAARAALAAVRSTEGGTAANLGDFFKSQLGVRSLEPRAGDDPDAVLSRAEAAVSEGRLEEALTEIETLPEGAQAALSDWTAQARSRSAALSAADTLSGTLN